MLHLELGFNLSRGSNKPIHSNYIRGITRTMFVCMLVNACKDKNDKILWRWHFVRKAANGDSPRIKICIKYIPKDNIKSTLSVLSNLEPILYQVPKPKFERQRLLHNVNRIKQFLVKIIIFKISIPVGYLCKT